MAKKQNRRQTQIVKDLPKQLPINIYAAKVFPILGSKSAANKAIQAQRLFLNGRLAKVSDMVVNGDQLQLKGTGVKKLKKINFDLEIIYEDDYLIVINKPSGIAVNGNKNTTVENALADKTRNNPIEDALPHPVAVHRIDVPTIGIVLLAKTKKALIQLGKAFQNSMVKKEYVAIVHGKIPPKGKITLPIKDKKAITEYEKMEVVPSKVFGHLSLVRLFPITGRTHQLRIHMQQEGHFIVGDKLYSNRKKTILGKGMMLCAQKISFEHPESGESINLQIRIPRKFKHVLDREKIMFKRRR